MHTATRCSARQGLRHPCQLGALHDGEHVSGERRWARSPREQVVFERQLAELKALRDQTVRWGRSAGG